MNIDKLINICTQFPDVRVMAIDDEQLEENYNSRYGSWRGSYDEPTLFFNGEGYITLKDLIPYKVDYFHIHGIHLFILKMMDGFVVTIV